MRLTRINIRSLSALLAISLLILTPAAAHDGAQYAAEAKDAAQKLHVRLNELAQSKKRPDYNKPPESALLKQIFDSRKLTLLPPANVSDFDWLLDWSGAANSAEQSILLFGSLGDERKILRNLAEYEDQHAIGVDFLFRIQGRLLTSMMLLRDQLTPHQWTATREAGLKRAQNGAEEFLEGTFGTLQPMNGSNARLIARALRDTAGVWVKFLSQEHRRRLVAKIDLLLVKIKDEQLRSEVKRFSDALAAAE
jgi:hypothetical protein